MGVYISTPFLARKVALCGGIGTVSGAMADRVLTEILLSGDPGGHYERALSHFPFPEIAERVLVKYLKKDNTPGQTRPEKVSLGIKRDLIELILCANFAIVWLAKEGHNHPIAINYLEKVQIPLVFGITGAMLAGVDQVTMGAGIPLQVASLLDSISRGEDAHYTIHIENSSTSERVAFSLQEFFGGNFPSLHRPDFFPIVSVHSLAEILQKKSKSTIQGFVVENYTAGGHNAPPRGTFSSNEKGEPVYSERDVVNISRMLDLGCPFWLAGGYASPQKRVEAEKLGAAGIQVGSIFALSSDSGLKKELRLTACQQLKEGAAHSLANQQASPTGFPFRIVDLKGTTAEQQNILNRPRACDVGALLAPYRKDDGVIGYRCPAEQVDTFVKKGGDITRTQGATCLCNGLLNASVLGKDGSPATLTLGSDVSFLHHLLLDGKVEYSAEDAMHYLLS